MCQNVQALLEAVCCKCVGGGEGGEVGNQEQDLCMFLSASRKSGLVSGFYLLLSLRISEARSCSRKVQVKLLVMASVNSVCFICTRNKFLWDLVNALCSVSGSCKENAITHLCPRLSQTVLFCVFFFSPLTNRIGNVFCKKRQSQPQIKNETKPGAPQKIETKWTQNRLFRIF